MSQTVNFATRTQNSSSTTTDIFIDSPRLGSFRTSPIVNSLSDHDAQFLTVHNITTKKNLIPLKQKIRKINKETIAQFQHLLENETKEPVYKTKAINYKFNTFLHIFLNICEASFPFQNKRIGRIKNNWITLEVKTSCKHKKRLYIYI
jgi:hypothetical protein